MNSVKSRNTGSYYSLQKFHKQDQISQQLRNPALLLRKRNFTNFFGKSTLLSNVCKQGYHLKVVNPIDFGWVPETYEHVALAGINY